MAEFPDEVSVMAWLRIDDRVRTHPKLVTVGPSAAWFWFCGICYCREHLTDGVIPAAMIPTLAPGVTGARKLAAQLVAAALWHVHPSGFEVHDFLEWNPSKAEVVAARDHDKARKRKGLPESEPPPVGFQTESERPPPGIHSPSSRAHAGAAGLGFVHGSGSSGSGDGISTNGTPAADGRGDWFWAEWRRAIFNATQVNLTAHPKAGEIPVLVELIGMASEADLLRGLERFTGLSSEQARALNIKALSLGYFRMALPRLLQPEPVVGVTARTSGNLSALQAFVAKGKAS